MRDHWPAAEKQRVEAGVPRGAGYVEAGWGDQQKQMTLPQGCCSHCPHDGLRTAEVSHWRLHLEQQSLQQKPWQDLKDTGKCH